MEDLSIKLIRELRLFYLKQGRYRSIGWADNDDNMFLRNGLAADRTILCAFNSWKSSHTRVGEGPFSPIFLKIRDRLDAQVFLGVFLYNKNDNILKKFKTEFLPPGPGV